LRKGKVREGSERGLMKSLWWFGLDRQIGDKLRCLDIWLRKRSWACIMEVHTEMWIRQILVTQAQDMEWVVREINERVRFYMHIV